MRYKNKKVSKKYRLKNNTFYMLCLENRSLVERIHCCNRRENY